MLFWRFVVLLQYKFYHILVLVTDESLNGVSCFTGASWNTTRSEGASETERWASWYCLWMIIWETFWSLVWDYLFTIINLLVILLTGIKTKKYNSLGNQYVHFNVSIPVWVLDLMSLFYVVYTTRKQYLPKRESPLNRQKPVGKHPFWQKGTNWKPFLEEECLGNYFRWKRLKYKAFC